MYKRKKKRQKINLASLVALSLDVPKFFLCLFDFIVSLTGSIVGQFIQICVSGHVLATFHASLVELGLEVGRGSGTNFVSGDVLSVYVERLEGELGGNLFQTVVS